MNSLSIKIIIMLFYFLPAAAGFSAETGTPRLEAAQVAWDFGSVPSDFKITHSFVVKNAGRDDLRVTKVVANCDCTVASIKDSIIAPGESSTVRILFNTREYYGTTNRKVTVFSNDPDRPVFDLDYSANIDYFHKLHTSDPKYLTFLHGQESKPIKLLNNSNDVVKFHLEKEPDAVFDLDQIEGEIRGGKNQPLTVNVQKNLKKGTYYTNFTVTFETTPPLRLTIPVKIIRY